MVSKKVKMIKNGRSVPLSSVLRRRGRASRPGVRVLHGAALGLARTFHSLFPVERVVPRLEVPTAAARSSRARGCGGECGELCGGEVLSRVIDGECGIYSLVYRCKRKK